MISCNSTYRLRYAPKGARQQRSQATMRAAHRKYLSEVKVKRRWLGNSSYRLRYWNRLEALSGRLAYSCNSTYRLRYWNLMMSAVWWTAVGTLQQYLSFTVLKPTFYFDNVVTSKAGCNSPYRLRYWNPPRSAVTIMFVITCNSTYRLLYWNTFAVSNCCNAPKFVVTGITLYDMRQSVRDTWEVKWRWESNISSPWPNNIQRLYQFR